MISVEGTIRKVWLSMPDPIWQAGFSCWCVEGCGSVRTTAEAQTKEEEAVSTGLAVQCQLWVSVKDPEARAAHFVTGDKSASVCENRVSGRMLAAHFCLFFIFRHDLIVLKLTSYLLSSKG